MTRLRSSKWFLPAFCVLLGLAFLVALWAGGDLREGLYALAFMGGVGLVLLLAGRTEALRPLRGDGGDERFRAIDVHAGAFTGLVLIIVLVALSLVRMANGDDIDPYGQLLAAAGVAYVGALAFMHWRG